MNERTNILNQLVACFLISLGLTAIALANHFNYHDLAEAGASCIGIGGCLMTGSTHVSQTTTKGGGPIINPPAEGETR